MSTIFTVRHVRERKLGWSVYANHANADSFSAVRIGSFGVDEDRAQAVAYDLNRTLDSHAERHQQDMERLTRRAVAALTGGEAD